MKWNSGEIEENSLKYYLKTGNIRNSLNKVHQKLTEFDTMIGSDI